MIVLWCCPKLRYGGQTFEFLHEQLTISSPLGRVITLGKAVLCGLAHVPLREKAEFCQCLIFTAVSALVLKDNIGG